MPRDDFNYVIADLNLRPNWTRQASTGFASADGSTCVGGSVSCYTRDDGPTASPQWAQADFPEGLTVGAWGPGVMLQTGAVSGYGVFALEGFVPNTWAFYLMSITAGTPEPIGINASNNDPPFSLRIEAYGWGVALFKKYPTDVNFGPPVASVVDHTFTSGKIGIISATAGRTEFMLDAWSGGILDAFDRRKLWLRSHLCHGQ